MTVIFNYAPNSEITKQRETIKTRLEQHNPVVSKIDLDCGLLQEVLSPDNKFSWGYWLKHHRIHY